MLQYKDLKIYHLRHAAFKIEDTKNGIILYIDPYEIENVSNDGHLVICTHDHYDHCSITDIKKVIRPDGIIIAAKNCAHKIGSLGYKSYFLNPYDTIEELGIKIKAVPAYNVNKRFHPRNYGGIGVIIEVNGVKIYHAGDTDLIPEMKEITDIDIALVPVSGTYVMTADEAATAVKIMKPKIAIPMHYGLIIGSRADAERFRKLVEDVTKVEILL